MGEPEATHPSSASPLAVRSPHIYPPSVEAGGSPTVAALGDVLASLKRIVPEGEILDFLSSLAARDAAGASARAEVEKQEAFSARAKALVAERA